MRGRKTGGRVKGSPNKQPNITASVLWVFHTMGQDAFLAWAKANASLFYTKVLPKVMAYEAATQGAPPATLTVEVVTTRAALAPDAR